jgi:hypothetical protein
MQLCNIGHIRRYITKFATTSLVNGLITSRLDYCNALLHGLPATMINKLQWVQNMAARIITRRSKYSHITPVLKELHWLPVQSRSRYKILIHIFKALHDQAPVYIREMLQVYQPTRTLRSQQSLTLTAHRAKTVLYGAICFPWIAPRLWNALPMGIRDIQTLPAFKRAIKTHLFLEHYVNNNL